RRVDRDLETVCLKCLEKEPAARYGSAEALAEDLERWLAGEPVQASPPSVTDRIRKFIRRNKGPVLAATLVFLALLGGIIGTTLGLIESKRQERLALGALRTAADQAEAEARQRRRARDIVNEMYFQVAEKWLAEQPRMQKVQR